MVTASIFWMMNEFTHVPWIERFSIFIHPNLYGFLYITFETFVLYRFSKILYKYPIVQKGSSLFTSKIDFLNSKHDPSKMTSIDK
jgi:hypothetical protein